MNRERLKELQTWLPPPKFCKNKYGEYTKIEALTILSTTLSNRWGNKFGGSTLRYEQELTDITLTLDGLTDDNIHMKQSIIPQIINCLTPTDYDTWFQRLRFEGPVALPSELVIQFINNICNCDYDLIVIGNKLHFDMTDISGEPVSYKMELPMWMLKIYYSDSFYLEILNNLTVFGSIFPKE